MKQPIRLFSIGVFATSIIVLVFYFFDDSKAKVDEVNVDEMITAIEADGYRVITESEYISLSVEDNTDKKATEQKEASNNEKNEEAESDKEQKETSEENSEKTYTLKIESGMPSSEIGSLLADNQIIDNADKFNQYLEEHGFSTKIQLGKFKLSSSMSNKEIAESLTK